MWLKEVVDFSKFKIIGDHLPGRYLVISFFCCFAEILNLQAQQQFSKFDYLTSNDGLSSNRIRCIYRDSNDFLWMGTDVGLDKYDSYDIKKYRFDEKKSGTISSNITTCIYEDRDNNLWFGTYDGLNLYDPSKDNFKVFVNSPADKNSINSNCITGIVEDNEGNLWIVSDGNCLNKWIPKTQKFIRYPYERGNKVLNARPSKMLAIDTKGYLWVVSLSRGIQRFDPESGKFSKYDDPSIDFGINCNKSLFIDNQDKIWITTDGNGFYSFDPATNKFEHYGSKGDGRGTNQGLILDIIPENDRYLLLAVDQGGLNRFDKVSKTFEYIMYDQAKDGGLNNSGIWCLHKDREGIIWIGTSGGGINYYNPKNERFKLFSHNNSNSLSYNFTGCFYEDHEGLIWIGTDGGGVNVYDPETGNFTIYKHKPSNPYSISGNVIRCITEDKDHDIWIGTWDAGLNRYDRKTGRFFHFMPDEKNPSSLSDKSVYDLIIDHNNILWLSIYNRGIDLFDPKSGVTRRFRTDRDNLKSLSSDNSWFFFEDSEKNMWICTSDGLNLYDSKTNSFKVYYFPDNNIFAFCKDMDGNLWVGTKSKGIYYCKPDGTIIKTYDITNGLPGNSISAIIEDNNGNIWISSNYGISILDRKTRNVRNYSKGDGLQGDEFFQQSFLKTRNGEIYFGGYNGFNSFHPDSLKDNDFVPPVYITDFQIFNKAVLYAVPESQFQTHISEAKEIKLTWRQSVFSFSFAAINYTYPEKNQYAYFMEGFEKEWNYTNASRRYVTYTNLNPGKYTFHVKASNNDGIWNEKGVSLQVIIQPPWWKTMVFRILLAMFIIGISFGFYFYRITSFKKQKVHLESLVKERTTEVEDKIVMLTQQALELNEINTLMEEHQQQIEEQAEELQVNSDILKEANEQLMAKQEMIASQAEDLEITNRKLTVLNATKDKLFSIIAHDLRNPFSSILSFSEILQTKFQDLTEEKKLKFIKIINDSSQRVFSLLESLLQWARTQTGNIQYNPEVFDLSDVVDVNYDLVKDLLKEKEITFTKNSPENTSIYADRNMINTVVRNLVGNAIKYTEKGKISVNIKNNKDFVEISITDSGIGISEKKMTTIFEIDQEKSTEGTKGEKGSGLGLLICKEFVQINGGEIFVKGDQGKGTTFTFTVPLGNL